MRIQHDEYISSSVWSFLSSISDSVKEIPYLIDQRLSKLFLNFTCKSLNTSVSNPTTQSSQLKVFPFRTPTVQLLWSAARRDHENERKPILCIWGGFYFSCITLFRIQVENICRVNKSKIIFHIKLICSWGNTKHLSTKGCENE